MPETKDTAEQELYALLALTLVPRIGDMLIRNLVSYCGSPAEVFKTSVAKLQKIPGIGPTVAGQVHRFRNWKAVEQELEFARRRKIRLLSYLEADYPQRLKNIPQSPVLLYYKGQADLNAERMLAIVGTRKATDYGRRMTEILVEGLKPWEVSIVSGLAFGIDVAAHQAALRHQLPTSGVLGHGLQTLYPESHHGIASRMAQGDGGLLTEFSSGHAFEKENFVRRNRIVAGMVDALVVMESASRGGALITAALANEFNRDVFAYPGDAGKEFSSGCNQLIKQNLATLMDSAEDLARAMLWERPQPGAVKRLQPDLFMELDAREIQVVELLKEKPAAGIDDITWTMQVTPSLLAATLLSLEMKGVICSLPGKRYRLA